jgi:quercetin dioxygenase-like cupin family protein
MRIKNRAATKTIRIGGKAYAIRAGDIIPIPKNTFHAVTTVDAPIEILVVTHPRFDRKDMTYEK